jgi:hypothetical protein
MSAVQTHLLQHAEDSQQAVATFGDSLRALSHRSSLPAGTVWPDENSGLKAGGTLIGL